jgi:hypothetical protein
MRHEQNRVPSVENEKAGVCGEAVMAAFAADGSTEPEVEETPMEGWLRRCPPGVCAASGERGRVARPRRGSRLRFYLRASLLLLITALALSAAADARSDYLIRLLKGSSQFRVRAGAAISLGAIKGSKEVVEALSGALKDDHPAVRAAAASSLERIGDPAALGALEASRNDVEKAVRAAVEKAIARLSRAAGSRRVTVSSRTPSGMRSTGVPRYYVGVGMPGTASRSVDRRLLEHARRFIQSRVSELDGVLIAPENESPGLVRKVLASKKLAGYYLDSSIVSIESQPGGGTRAVVSVIVGTYPERDMKMILQGAATVIGSDSRGETQAVEGAFRGALRRLPQALESGQR